MDLHSLQACLKNVEILRAQGQAAAAEDLCHRLLQEFPGFADGWNLLGVLHADAGRQLAAADSFERASQLAPHDATFPANLGELQRRAGLAQRAIEHCRRALALDSQNATARLNLGFALLDTGQAAEAAEHLRWLAQRDSRQASAWFGLARAHLMGKDYAAALECLHQCASLSPQDPEVMLAMAQALRCLGQSGAALEQAGRAASRLPGHPAVVSLQADLMLETGRPDAAEALVRSSLRVGAPAPAALLYRLSLCRLAQGDYLEGFALFESRLHLTGHDVSNPIMRPLLPMPYWQGEALQGRRLLVLTEQGYGDHIQFCRFIPHLTRLGANVVLGVGPALEDLMRSLPGCERIVTRIDDTRSSGCDYWTFVASLPHRLRIGTRDLGTAGPYLQAEEARRARWRERLAPLGGARRIGLVWGGRPENEYERRRSVPLAELAPLAQVPGVRWISLQMGPQAQAIARDGAALNLEVINAQELGSFADTAALMAELDAVVAVDTAFAHLAGALGRPLHLMLPLGPDWRWWLHPERSDWYPSVRLYRQSAAGRWDDVVERLVGALSDAQP